MTTLDKQVLLPVADSLSGVFYPNVRQRTERFLDQMLKIGRSGR